MKRWSKNTSKKLGNLCNIQPNRLIVIKWSVRTLTNYLEKKVTQFKNGEKPGAGISKKKKTTQIS